MIIKKIAVLFITIIMVLSLSISVFAAEATTEDKNDEENTTAGLNVGTLSGVGLVAVGGAGSIIIARNMKKPKDEPSSEIKAEDRNDLYLK